MPSSPSTSRRSFAGTSVRSAVCAPCSSSVSEASSSRRTSASSADADIPGTPPARDRCRRHSRRAPYRARRRAPGRSAGRGRRSAARRPERARITLDESRAIRRAGRPEARATRADADHPRPRRELQLDQRRDHPEPGAQVERQRRRVEALLDQPDLRDARAGRLDATLDEEPSDAAPLHARLDRDGSDGGDGPALMEPRHPHHSAIQLRHQPAERIEGEEMAHVAARVRRCRHHRLLSVAERDVVEGDEVDVARAVGVAFLQGTDRRDGHRHHSPGDTNSSARGRAAPVFPCGQVVAGEIDARLAGLAVAERAVRTQAATGIAAAGAARAGRRSPRCASRRGSWRAAPSRRFRHRRAAPTTPGAPCAGYRATGRRPAASRRAR